MRFSYLTYLYKKKKYKVIMLVYIIYMLKLKYQQNKHD